MDVEEVLPIHEEDKRISHALPQRKCTHPLLGNTLAQMRTLRLQLATLLYEGLQGSYHELPPGRCSAHLPHLQPHEPGQKRDPSDSS